MSSTYPGILEKVNTASSTATTANTTANAALPKSGGTMTGSLYVGSTSGEQVLIYSNSEGGNINISHNGGQFEIDGNDLNGSTGWARMLLTGAAHYLTLYENGYLKWDSKEIERVNSSGTYYIRYESGLQICWDYGDISGYYKDWTFPVAFKDNNIAAFVRGRNGGTSTNDYVFQCNTSTTTIRTICDTADAWHQYLAIGWWK